MTSYTAIWGLVHKPWNKDPVIKQPVSWKEGFSRGSCPFFLAGRSVTKTSPSRYLYRSYLHYVWKETPWANFILPPSHLNRKCFSAFQWGFHPFLRAFSGHERFFPCQVSLPQVMVGDNLLKDIQGAQDAGLEYQRTARRCFGNSGWVGSGAASGFFRMVG